MKHLVAILLTILAAGGALRADEVWLMNRKFDKATVLGLAAGQLRFRWQGETFSPALVDVKRIAINGQDRFNRAEALFAASRFTDAAAEYDAYIKSAGRDWRRSLATLRLRKAKSLVGTKTELIPADPTTPETFLEGKPPRSPSPGRTPAETEMNRQEHDRLVKAWLAERIGKKVQWMLEV